MAILTYEFLKQCANTSSIPCTILSVEKKPDGSCGDIRFYAINEVFKKSYYDMFAETEGQGAVDYDSFQETIEGQLYTAHLPKEPNFEDICFRAAWKNEYINTYVDTTRMYGYWTQDILLPIHGESENPNIAYCQFMYTLNKEMDSGQFASVSPDIASFVIKSCLELRNENDFETSMAAVTADIREYTQSYAASIVTIDRDFRSYEIISESVRNDEIVVKEVFKDTPYEIIETWANLCRDTNSIIIKNDADMDSLSERAPEWVAHMRENDVKSLVLVPFVHQGDIIGFLYITNFDTQHLMRVKETVELVSFFLASEIANHLFLQRLEYLSNVDMLTGVFNRNCMNVNVDEMALKLEFNPKPFNVAFFDLNGLKSVNDNGGHDQGDKLLVYAAQMLKDIFKDDKIYRAGGDEFVAISFDSKNNFAKKIEELKEKASDPDWLYFAIGWYHDEYDGKLRLAMRYADEEMYKDKDKFYEKYPEKRR